MPTTTLLEGGLTFREVRLWRSGYELLGSDGVTVAFSTPLATLHAFEGWADKFLATPAAGITDSLRAHQRSVRQARPVHEHQRLRALPRFLGRSRQRALRRGARPAACRADGAPHAHGEVRRLPRRLPSSPTPTSSGCRSTTPSSEEHDAVFLLRLHRCSNFF